MTANQQQKFTAFETAMPLIGVFGAVLLTSVDVLKSHLVLLAFSGVWAILTILLAIAIGEEMITARRNGSRYRIPLRTSLWLVPTVALATSAAIVGLGSIAVVGIALLSIWVKDPTTNTNVALWVCVPLAFVAGGCLFLFRLRFRMVYGLMEIAAGLVVAWFQTTSVRDSSALGTGFLIAFTTAALFLIVRGMDNVHQGYTTDNPDPVARFIRANSGNEIERPGL
ncbi:hypothetical protein [Variovorax sp. Sphag1AA]|uniref:hypothetical protein n=1 Tax=Variovorax sp. Sphag1AA TaxID=2587027 RepID=UPI00161F6420|nr:hypothetical protein [Variovorax sp. Sphag1AA]MBB3180963.1 hypothetical protein [Variovorax sp. Sphag1AA]